MKRRETFILQFDITGEPNETLCTSVHLAGGYIRYDSIPSATASDIFEIISGEKLWPAKNYIEAKITPETIEEINDILRERKENE